MLATVVISVLTPENAGYIFLLESIVIISSVVFSFASDEVLRRFIYVDKFSKDDLNSPINAIDILNIFLIFLFLPSLIFWEDKYIIFSIIVGILTSYRPPYVAANVAQNKLKNLAKETTLTALVVTTISISFIYSSSYIEIRLILLLFQSIFFRIFLRSPYRLSFSSLKKCYNEYLKVSPIYINRIFGIITSHALPMVVILFVDLSAYGKYQFLIKVASVLVVIQATLNQAIESSLIKLFNKTKNISKDILNFISKNAILIFFAGIVLYFSLLYFSELLNMKRSIIYYNLIYLILASLVLFYTENIWRIHKFIGKVKYLSFVNIFGFLVSVLVIFLLSFLRSELISHFALTVLFSNIFLLFFTFLQVKKNEQP